jgi:hypothetical protein
MLIVCLVGCIGAEQKTTIVPSIETCSLLQIDIDRYAQRHMPSRISIAFGVANIEDVKEKLAKDWLAARWKDIMSQQKEIDNCWRSLGYEVH